MSCLLEQRFVGLERRAEPVATPKCGGDFDLHGHVSRLTNQRVLVAAHVPAAHVWVAGLCFPFSRSVLGVRVGLRFPNSNTGQEERRLAFLGASQRTPREEASGVSVQAYACQEKRRLAFLGPELACQCS